MMRNVGKIIVVDDEEKIRYIFRKILESQGHEVMEADSGKQCLEILKNKKPDLILMDVMMPEMDGWEAVKEIKKDRANKDIIISMLTVRSEDGDIMKILDEAHAWYITKPVTKDKLVQTVEWLLKRPVVRSGNLSWDMSLKTFAQEWKNTKRTADNKKEIEAKC